MCLRELLPDKTLHKNNNVRKWPTILASSINVTHSGTKIIRLLNMSNDLVSELNDDGPFDRAGPPGSSNSCSGMRRILRTIATPVPGLPKAGSGSSGTGCSHAPCRHGYPAACVRRPLSAAPRPAGALGSGWSMNNVRSQVTAHRKRLAAEDLLETQS